MDYEGKIVRNMIFGSYCYGLLQHTLAPAQDEEIFLLSRVVG